MSFLNWIQWRMEDEECKMEFRFHKNDVYNLVEILDLPDQITCYNGLVFDPTEAICIFLKHFPTLVGTPT